MTGFRWVLLLGVVAGVWMPPVTGRACSYPAPGVFVPESVPSNGAVSLQRTCGLDACTVGSLEGVEVLDVTTGMPVSGTLVHADVMSPGSAYWKPDAPLKVGRQYEVRVADSDSLGTTELPTFTVTAPVVFDVDGVVVTAELHRTEQAANDAIDCSGPYDSCGGNPVVHRQRRWLADLALRAVVAGDDGLLPTQYVIHTTFRGADGVALDDTWSTRYASFGFEQRDSEYCYEVVVQSLIDDSTATHSGCVPHGDLGEIGEEDLSEQELLKALVGCDGVKNPEDRDLWCKAQLEKCAEVQGENADLVCNPRIEACGGEPVVPTDPATDAGEPVEPGEDSDASVPMLDDGLPAEAAGNFDNDAKEPPSAAACSVTQPGQNSGSAVFAVLLLLLTLRVLGSERSRRSEP